MTITLPLRALYWCWRLGETPAHPNPLCMHSRFMRAPLSSGCVLTLRAQQGKAHRCYHRNQSSFDLWWYEQEEAGWRVDTWCWWAATCAVCVWWAICNVQPLSSVCFSYILQLASIRVRLLYMYEEETIMQTWGFFYFFTIFPIISIWLMLSLSPEKEEPLVCCDNAGPPPSSS